MNINAEQIRKALALQAAGGRSLREIEREIGASHTTVSRLLDKAEALQLTAADAELLNDRELAARFKGDEQFVPINYKAVRSYLNPIGSYSSHGRRTLQQAYESCYLEVNFKACIKRTLEGQIHHG